MARALSAANKVRDIKKITRPEAPTVFLDTSAYLMWALDQPGSQELNAIFIQSKLVASSILFIESERAFIHLARTRAITHENALMLRASLVQHVRHFVVREPSLEICLSNRFPGMTTPKSADLIHLRTALWFMDNGGLQKFITRGK